MTIDGLNVGNPPGGNQPPGFSVDVGNSEEISFTTSGGLGESETAGLVMNVVPKTGGNSIHGSMFYSGSGKNLQSDNSEGTGVAAPTPLTKIYDVNGVGGWTDHERRTVVLRHRAHTGRHARECESVRQSERRRRDANGSMPRIWASRAFPIARGRTSAGV